MSDVQDSKRSFLAWQTSSFLVIKDCSEGLTNAFMLTDELPEGIFVLLLQGCELIREEANYLLHGELKMKPCLLLWWKLRDC